MDTWFARIPARAAGCKRLAAADWRVFVAIASHADRDGRGAFPALARIARLAGIDRTKVPRSIRRIEAAGLLRVDRRKNKHGDSDVNRYEIVFDDAGLLPDLGTPGVAADISTVLPDLGTPGVAKSGNVTDQFLTEHSPQRKGCGNANNDARERQRFRLESNSLWFAPRPHRRTGRLLQATLDAVEAAEAARQRVIKQ